MGPKKTKSLSSTNSKGFEWVDFEQLVTRYNNFSTIDSVFTEVGKFRLKHGNSVRIDWHAMVGNTSSGISNACEYQMIWRHLAYKKPLLEKIEDGAEPLDDDSDLDIEPAYMKTEPATTILSLTGSANNDQTNSNPGSGDKRVSPTRTEEAADNLILFMKSSDAKQVASPSTYLAAASEESRASSPDESLNPSSTPQAPLEQSATPGGDMADPGIASSHAALFSAFREAQARVAWQQSTNFDTGHIASSVASNSASPPSTRILSKQTTTDSGQNNVQGASTEEEVDGERGTGSGSSSGTGNESYSGDADKPSSESGNADKSRQVNQNVNEVSGH